MLGLFSLQATAVDRCETCHDIFTLAYLDLPIPIKTNLKIVNCSK
jgi:hypothetical protein